MADDEDVLDRAAQALPELILQRGWRAITLRDIAEAAGVSFADLYARADSPRAVLARLSARLDRGALDTAATPSEDPHDRLFDAVMGRIEAMAPHRDALIALASQAPLAVAENLPRAARAMLEAAGVSATPPRLAAMTAVWLRVARVWRDDDGALNRTMAEIDKRLRQMRSRLGRIGAGF